MIEFDFKKTFYFGFGLFLFRCVCVGECACVQRWLQRTQEGTESPRAKVAGRCELPDMCPGSWLRLSSRAISNCRAVILVPSLGYGFQWIV